MSVTFLEKEFLPGVVLVSRPFVASISARPSFRPGAEEGFLVINLEGKKFITSTSGPITEVTDKILNSFTDKSISETIENLHDEADFADVLLFVSGLNLVDGTCNNRVVDEIENRIRGYLVSAVSGGIAKFLTTKYVIHSYLQFEKEAAKLAEENAESFTSEDMWRGNAKVYGISHVLVKLADSSLAFLEFMKTHHMNSPIKKFFGKTVASLGIPYYDERWLNGRLDKTYVTDIPLTHDKLQLLPTLGNVGEVMDLETNLKIAKKHFEMSPVHRYYRFKSLYLMSQHYSIDFILEKFPAEYLMDLILGCDLTRTDYIKIMTDIIRASRTIFDEMLRQSKRTYPYLRLLAASEFTDSEEDQRIQHELVSLGDLGVNRNLALNPTTVPFIKEEFLKDEAVMEEVGYFSTIQDKCEGAKK